MSKDTSVVIGDHLKAFVEAQVAAGRYDSASDVVRAGLRLLEERETKLAALRAALTEGETSGASTPFDFEAFIAKKRAGDAPRWNNPCIELFPRAVLRRCVPRNEAGAFDANYSSSANRAIVVL